MAIQIRCDKCGALVEAPAGHAKSAPCGECGRRTSVPASLAVLPRPLLPPDDPPADREPSCPVRTPREILEHSQHHHSGLTGTLAVAMPWVLSVFLHLGVVVVFAFVVMFVVQEEPPDLQRPGDARTAMNVTFRMPLLAPKQVPVETGQQQIMPEHPRPTDPLRPAGGPPKEPERIIGRPSPGGVGTPKDLPGGPGKWGTPGVFDPIPGTKTDKQVPLHVVYVVDRSGSMTETFETVRHDMLRSISHLQPGQTFHVILFRTGTPLEMPARRLVPVSRRYRIDAADFLTQVTAAGQTDPIPALRRARSVLSGASPRGAKLIHLLTDGNFPDNDAVLAEARKLFEGSDVRINTTLHGPPNPQARKVLQEIARITGGEYRYKKPTE